MFDKYAKKLDKIHANTPEIFNKTALKGAKFAENTAKNITDNEKLVDTGCYKRSWYGEMIEPEKGIYGIVLENNAEYASYLEFGHKTPCGCRVKGRFVGRRTLEETHVYCMEELYKVFEKELKNT